jgi:hypothetical protein
MEFVFFEVAFLMLIFLPSFYAWQFLKGVTKNFAAEFCFFCNFFSQLDLIRPPKAPQE